MKATFRFLTILVFWMLVGTASTSAGQPVEPPPPATQRAYPPGPEAGYPLVSIEQSRQITRPQVDEMVAPQAIDSFYWTRGVVTSLRDNDLEIYSMATMGYTQSFVRLTNRSGDDYQPRLSPDTQKISFTSSRSGDLEIWVMSWDGADPLRLTWSIGYDGEAVWSPDGKRLAFVSKRTGGYEIFTMASDGSNPTQLTYTGGNSFSPTWSPDGAQIAFVMAVDSTHGIIMKVNANGGAAVPISAPLRLVADLDWSPLGSRLAFDYDANGDGWLETGIIDLDSNGVTSIVAGYYLKDAYLGSWDPSGTYLFYSDVRYVLSGGAYYIKSATLSYITLSGSNTTFTQSLFDIQIDAETADHSIPLSYIEQLPRFSRSGNFLVRWKTYDPGPLPAEVITIQPRPITSATWWNWLTNRNVTPSYEIYPHDLVGVTLYFRSQARDGAGHLEPWPEGDGDAFTTLYKYKLDGSVSDNRGYSVPNTGITLAPLSANPVITTSAQGNFSAYTTARGLHTLQYQHSGYGNSEPVSVYLTGDQEIVTYLPPGDNQVLNGGFEIPGDPLANWNVGGTMSVTTAAGHSGQFSVSLGNPCQQPCLAADSPPSVELPLAQSGIAMVADHQGNLHVLFGHHWYSVRNSFGIWSNPVELPGIDAPIGKDDLEPALEVDQDGTLHAVIRGSNDLFYLQKRVGYSWSAPISIGKGHNPATSIDSTGTLYIMYYTLAAEDGKDSISYRTRTALGLWGDPKLVLQRTGYYDIAIGPDDTAHYVYSIDNFFYYYRTARYLSMPLYFDEYYINPTLEVDPMGNVHVVASNGVNARYWVIDLFDKISTPTDLMYPGKLFSIAFDNEGNIAIAAGAEDGFARVIYKHQLDTNFTVFEAPAFFQNPQSVSLVADSTGSFHLIFTDPLYINFYSRKQSGEGGDSYLQQSFEIPEDMHSPTLAMLYSLEGGHIEGNSRFLANLQSNISQTVLLDLPVEPDWSIVWADLSPWSGKHITLTLRLEQEADEPIIRVRLDEISLGSWLTPRISSVAPSETPARTAVQVTINGENFIDTPSVRIGDLPASQVLFVDSNTLTAMLPADLAPGIYPLTVTNPGGQEAAYLSLVVGEHIYLPMLGRQALP